MIISNAGMLTRNCTCNSGAWLKWALIIPNAGAIAAPAITVSSDIDRIVAVTLLETFVCVISSIGVLAATRATHSSTRLLQKNRPQRYKLLSNRAQASSQKTSPARQKKCLSTLETRIAKFGYDGFKVYNKMRNFAVLIKI